MSRRFIQICLLLVVLAIAAAAAHAQLPNPYGASIEDAKRKLEYDLYYIKNQNLALDATIMFETIKTILFGKGT